MALFCGKKANFLLLSMDEDLTLKAYYKDGVNPLTKAMGYDILNLFR